MTEPQPAQAAAETIEADLHDACQLIRRHWQTLLEPTTRPTTGSPSTDTLTATERRILIRQQVDHTLTRWCRAIISGRSLRHAGLPDGGDQRIEAMLTLIERHAAWFAAEHDDAARAARQLARVAAVVESTAVPPVREYVRLGPCPFVLPDPDGTLDDGGRTLLWPCLGDILTRIGGDGYAHCTGCGQEAVREWWEEVLGLRLPWCNLPGLVPILHRRLGLRVTDRTLRNWRRDGVITPALRPEDHEPYGDAGHEPPGGVGPRLPEAVGPRLAWDLFDPLDVIEDLADAARACALCGKPLDAPGDLCRRCWRSTMYARPTIVDEADAPPTVAGVALLERRDPAGPVHGYCRHQSCRTIRATLPARRVQPGMVADPHDTDRPARCHWSDLPADQCACGRHNERKAP